MRPYETREDAFLSPQSDRPHRRWSRLLPATLLLALALVPGLHSTALARGGDLVWQVTDTQAGRQEAVASAMDSAGNVIVTGNQNLTGGTDDNLFTVKVRGDGSGVAWRAVFDKAGGEDRALAVAVDGNDDVIVAGYVWNGINRDIQVIKYNGATGAVLWQHTLNGAAGGGDIGTAVAVDASNNIYVGANSQNAAGNDDIVLLKYAPTGPQNGLPLWQATYGGTGGIDQVNAVTAGDNGVALTGKSWNGTAYDMVTLLYDHAGTKLWERRFSTGSGAGNGCIGNQVRFAAGGDVIAVGSVANGSNLDVYTARYQAATGAVVWQQIFDGGFDEEPLGLFLDGGDVYVTGYTYTLTGANDFFSARYNGATGAAVWQQMYDSGHGNTDMAVATGIVVDPAGDVFVTGYTVTDGNYDFRTIKYKRENGTLLWQQSYNSPAGRNDRPVGIAISPSGSVVVAGWSDTVANDLDIVTLAYDKGLLDPATGLAAVATSATSIALTWSDNSANEDGFRIERKLGETGAWGQVATVPANTVAYADAGLAANNAYYYRVTAYNAAQGDSHPSNEAHALTVFVNFTAPAWSFGYNNPDNTDDYANAVAVGPDNNPVVTGYSNRSVGTFDYFTLKLNRTDRSVVWSDQYDDADGEMDEAKCLAVDSGNNVIVSGISQLFYPPAERNINSIFTIKYPASGPPATWHGQYNGPGAIDDRATAIATTTDGANNVVVIGYGKNGNNNDDIYVVKYPASPALNQQGGALPAWSATPFDRGGSDIPSAIAVAPDGSVFVTGISEKTPGSNMYNWFTARYDGSTGALVWSDTYSVTPGGTNRGAAIAVDANGDVYVTGTATTASLSSDIYLIKYSGSSSTPERLWERAIDGAAGGDDAGVSVRVDPLDGAVVVAGNVLTATGDRDIALFRYTSGGDPIWQRTLLQHDSDDTAIAMELDASGYIYVAGNSVQGAASDIVSVIYDYEGNLIGAALYDGSAGGVDEASSIVANHKGEAFIAGYSVNAAGNADYVVLKQVNNFLLVPAPFAAAPAGSSAVNLSWGSNTAGTTYLVERTAGPVNGLSSWQQIAAPPAGAVSYQDAGLLPNASYCYRITAVSGSFSSRKLLSCATTAPASPVLERLTRPSVSAIDLAWNTIAGNAGYKIERSTDSTAWGQVGGTVPAGSTVYHDTGLADGVVYYYRVTTLSPSGPSLPSAVQVAPVLNTPTGVTSAKIDLSWPAVAGSTGYRLERSTDAAAWVQIATPAAAAISYSDTAVAAGVSYYYRLTAVTAAGVSVPSVARTAKTKLKTPVLSTPVAGSTTQITASWTDPNTNEAGYLLEYAACYYDNPTSCSNPNGGSWGGWVAAPQPADSTAATVASLVAGRTYRFRVTGTLSGADSDASAMAVATTALGAPANLAATAATSSSVALTWTDVEGNTEYRVEQNGVLLAVTLTQNSTAYTVPGLSPNTEYCFRVKPANAYSSAFSNQACVTIYDAPTLTSAVPDPSAASVTLSWTAVPGSTGYEVWRSMASSQSYPPASPTTGSWGTYINLTPTPLTQATYASTGLSYGYTYKYKIRYRLPDGSFSPYSNEVMAVTIPPVPAGVSGTVVSTSQITFYWSNGYGESSYSYQLKQRTGASCTTEDWTGIAATTVAADTSSFSATGLAAGATYCFRVNATNGVGTTAWSSAASQTTLLPAPTLNAPTGITQSAITLSWTSVAGNNGYRIDRSSDGYSFIQVATPAVNAVSYTDTGLLPNQAYTYRISTRNSAGVYSVVSNVQSATTLPVEAPVFAALSGIATDRMTLSWNDVPGNAGYMIERSPDNTTWTQVATPATGATSYLQTGLQAGTLYYFRISTRNSAGGYSVASNVQSAVTTPAAPAVPSVTVVSESRIDLQWQLVPGATDYRVVRSIGTGGPWTEAGRYSVPFSTKYCGIYTTPSIGCPSPVAAYTTAGDTGLAPDTTYCYKLTAANATGGDSAASPAACGKTPAVGGPVLTAVTALNSLKVRVEWSYDPAACVPAACSAPDGYEVWRQLVNGEWGVMGTTAATTYTDTIAIEPSAVYQYKVRAYRGGDRSRFSNVLKVTTPGYETTDSTCP